MLSRIQLIVLQISWNLKLHNAMASDDWKNFNNLDEWIAAQNNGVNEVRIFWANMLQYLTVYVGYYFAIRSGNFGLRNACLPFIVIFLHMAIPTINKLCVKHLET